MVTPIIEPSNPALTAFCALLEAGPAEVARSSELPYQTVRNWLNGTNRHPRGANLWKLVRGLRLIAKDRARRGLPSLPPKAITADALCSPLASHLGKIESCSTKSKRSAA